MVSAWYMDDSDTDQRFEHCKMSHDSITIDQLKKMVGILYWKLDPESEEDKLTQIKAARGYTFSDIIEIIPEKLPNYEEKVKNFYEEHLHTDEEIRYVLEGSGYFDIRDNTDKWIRIKVERGDLLVLPAGIYHRFTIDTKNYIKVRRLFVGEPVWTPYKRPADEMEVRKNYIREMNLGFPSLEETL